MTRDNAPVIATCITIIVILVVFFLFLFLINTKKQASRLLKQVQRVQQHACKASWTQAGNQVEYTVLEIKGHEYIACGRMVSGSIVTLTHAASCPCMKHTVK